MRFAAPTRVCVDTVAIGIACLPALCGRGFGQCVPQWLPMPPGQMVDHEVQTMKVWDLDGTGTQPPLLLAAGNFEHAGGQLVKYVACWSGSQWAPLGSGLDGSGFCFEVYDPDLGGPSAPELLIGGLTATSPPTRPTPMRWQGSAWVPVGLGVGGVGFPEVHAMKQFGPDLIVIGVFEAAGGVPAHRIARWDGASWHSMDSSIMGVGYALEIRNGQLVAGGDFQTPSSPPFPGVMQWNGSVWTVVGSNVPTATVKAMTTYRGRLIAGGYFNSQCCGTQPGEHIAMFDGTTWLPLGTGMNDIVLALTTFDPDGAGPMPELLIAGGYFTVAGGVPAAHIAAWDGTQWSPLGSGTNGEVESLCVYNNQLYVGGFFSTGGGQFSPYLTRYGCPVASCYANCDQSTAAPVLNVNDFMCFINSFASGNPAANCDQSTTPPALNSLDFSCYLNRFAAGCL